MRRQPRALDDGNEADRRRGRVVVLGVLVSRGPALVLGLHVVDLDHLQAAVRGAGGERHAGVLHVHVHAQRRGVADDEHGLALRLRESSSKYRAVESRALHDVLDAVAVALVLDAAEVHLAGRCGRRLRQRLAAHAVEQARQHDGDALAAGVDDSGLAQARQQIGRALHARLGFLDRDGEHRVEGERGVGLRRDGGGLAHDRQHRALDGLGHRVVGRLRGAAERGAELRGTERIDALEGVGDAAQHLREDDAAVAARAEQRRVGERLADRARPAGLGQGRVRGAQREQHVGPGIAVRHGVDVDRVERLAVGLEPEFGDLEGVAQVRAAEGRIGSCVGRRHRLLRPRSSRAVAPAAAWRSTPSSATL